MPRAQVDVWLTGAGSAAIKMPLRELGGSLVRRFTVPMETVLFVRLADGQQRVHPAGDEVDTRETAVALLVRSTRIEVPFEFDELAAEDDFWIDALCRLAVRAVPKAGDLASLLDRAVGAAAELTTDGLRDLFETPVRTCLAAYCRARKAADLTGADHTAAVEQAIREAVAKTTFTCGLEFLGLDRLALSSRRKGRPKRVVVERTRQFLIATGRQVLVFDPLGCGGPQVAYQFPADLGPLRSVRVVTAGGQRHVAGGARDGVYLTRPGAAEGALLYPFAQPTRGRTGVNAVACHEHRLFASHAEHGVTEWALDQPGAAGRPVLADLTRGARACRQVQVTPDGRLAFALDRSVVTLDLTTPGAGPILYREAPGEVSAVYVGPTWIAAGTDRGEVVRWQHDAPESPLPLLRKGHAVYGLTAVYLDGLVHLVVAARDYAVTAINLDDQTETVFRSPRRQLRWVAGASDFLAGIDHERETMLVWDTAAPARPLHTIPIRPLSGHTVQDLVCWREMAGRGRD